MYRTKYLSKHRILHCCVCPTVENLKSYKWSGQKSFVTSLMGQTWIFPPVSQCNNIFRLYNISCLIILSNIKQHFLLHDHQLNWAVNIDANIFYLSRFDFTSWTASKMEFRPSSLHLCRHSRLILLSSCCSGFTQTFLSAFAFTYQSVIENSLEAQSTPLPLFHPQSDDKGGHEV